MKLQNAFTSFHVAMYRLTGGLLGWRFKRLRMLVLTTTGSKSGKKRSGPLAYRRDGKTLLLNASNGGAPDPPSRYKNLKANPEATVQVGSRLISVRTRDAEGEERDRLWESMT